MYRLLESAASPDVLGVWARYLGRYTSVVGYSRLGSFFLADPETGDYLVLHPLLQGNNSRRYGPFSSVDHFRQRVLEDPAFIREILRPADLAVLEARLGPLKADEVYFPVPYPFLGGSGELNTFEKGDVWVFADLVGQSLGLE